MERSVVAFDETIPAIHELLSKLTRRMRERSRKVLADITVKGNDVKSLKEAMREKKIVEISWCGKFECAEKIKTAGGGEIRGSPFNDVQKPKTPCLICGEKGEFVTFVARAY